MPPPICFSPIDYDKDAPLWDISPQGYTSPSAPEDAQRAALQEKDHNAEFAEKENKALKKGEVQKIYPITEVFNSKFLAKIKAKSSSRSNFATNLVRSFFKPAVRMASNVSGKCGKMQLDKQVMAAIRVATFKVWPCNAAENEAKSWADCVKAIDEAGRRLYHPKKKAEN